jgi:hypothetical protein
VAAFLAVLFPGLGHFYLGRVRQGILIMGGILGLYGLGVLIGGISCIDRRDNFVWFLGQALVGPLTLGLDQYHQNHLKVLALDRNSATILRSANPDETRDPSSGYAVKTFVGPNGLPAATINGQNISPAWPPYVKSISRTNDLGTLFTTIAGFLNVIVIIDAAWNHRFERRRTPASASAAGGAGTRTLRVPGREGTPGGGA